jgi:hypothetical protein
MIALYFDYILDVVEIIQRKQLNTSHVVRTIKIYVFQKMKKIIS